MRLVLTLVVGWTLIPPAAASPSTLSSFALGGGGSRLGSEQARSAPPPTSLGVLGFGWKILDSTPLYARAIAETFRLYSVAAEGAYQADRTRHEGIGAGLALSWMFGDFHVEWSLTRGALDSNQSTPTGNIQKSFDYWSPRVEGGYAIFRSDTARVSVNYDLHSLRPDRAWQRDYGYKSVITSQVLLAIYLSLSRNHRFLEAE